MMPKASAGKQGFDIKMIPLVEQLPALRKINRKTFRRR
jgi:hypothetical protein